MGRRSPIALPGNDKRSLMSAAAGGRMRMGWRWVVASPGDAGQEFGMELRYALCCVLAAACAVTASASQRPQVESDQQILIGLERRWNEAFYRKDVAFIESILADEFVATYDDGSRGDKARELALVAEFNQKVVSAVLDEFTVKVYRDTAVVWFTLHLVGIKQGQRSELMLRYSDVWVIRDGRWQCVSAHSTRVNPK
jgi:ketosteroid isomerase-like protein